MCKVQLSRLIELLVNRVTLVLCVFTLLAFPFAYGRPGAVAAGGARAPQAADMPRACTELGLSSLSAAAHADLVWKGKSELRVLFLDGSPDLQRRVSHHASTWNRYSHLPFVFVDHGPSEIRVSFTRNGRSWSYIGNSAEYVGADEATMNFGWFDDATAEEDLRRTTLHEFGHALGLIHEHQSPAAAIRWNRPAVYKYYERHFAWNENVVNDNIFKKYERTRTQYGSYDPTSIMHYPIPKEFTTDGSSVGWNTDLSPMDKAFVGGLYSIGSR